MTNVKEPPLPRYNYKHMSRARRILLEDRLVEFHGVNLTEDYLHIMADVFWSVMPGASTEAIRQSLMYLAGTTLTPEAIKEVTHRLTGNHARLRKGELVLPWTGQDRLEWAPVQVMQYKYEQLKSRTAGGRFQMRFLAGSPCPDVTYKFWSKNFCYVLARRLGYTSARYKHPISHPAELVGLRFMVLLDPKLCHGKPGFERTHCPPALLKRNREIIARRAREFDGKPAPCPRGFTHKCVDCFVGYDQCSLATHPTTEVRRDNATPSAGQR